MCLSLGLRLEWQILRDEAKERNKGGKKMDTKSSESRHTEVRESQDGLEGT